MTQPIAFRPLLAPKPLAVGEVHKQLPVSAKISQPVAVPLARLTSLVKSLADEGPPVDHARIAQLRQAIASGHYRPDAAAIADAMLRHHGWPDP